ncbi:DUF4433 domain-containing protein [Candidatus Palauibacter sp.]|uniref:DUF4433 domain-containing protein n=1 Tax=Candidatus Palauibacter sp. TaxID=3101350 RepID=UPI003B017879
MYRAIAWAEGANRRWAFTASNAGSSYFEDWSDLEELHRIDWPAVQARDWRDRKEGKQAEFLITRIGVHSTAIQRQANEALRGAEHVPRVEVKSDWYY